MYIRAYVCIYVCMHLCVCMYTYAVCMYLCQMPMCVCMYACCMYVCMRVCICAYVCMLCVCLYVCMYLDIYKAHFRALQIATEPGHSHGNHLLRGRRRTTRSSCVAQRISIGHVRREHVNPWLPLRLGAKSAASPA